MTDIQERQNEFGNALRGQAITEQNLLADSLIRVSTNDLVTRKKNGEVYIRNFRVRVRDVPRLVDHLRGQNRDDYAVQRLCDQLAQAAIGKDPDEFVELCYSGSVNLLLPFKHHYKRYIESQSYSTPFTLTRFFAF